MNDYQTPTVDLSGARDLSASQMPPIYYHHHGPGGDKEYVPNTTNDSLERLKQKLMASLTREEAMYILTPEGKQDIVAKLYDKAHNKINYDTGPFTDGSEAIISMAQDWEKAAWPIYEEAATAKLDELDGGSSGGSGGAGDAPGGSSGNSTGATPSQAGFSTSLYAVVGTAALSAGGYALYQLQQS